MATIHLFSSSPSAWDVVGNSGRHFFYKRREPLTDAEMATVKKAIRSIQRSHASKAAYGRRQQQQREAAALPA